MVSDQNFSVFQQPSKLGRNSGRSVFFVQPLLRSKTRKLQNKQGKPRLQTMTTGFKRSSRTSRARSASLQTPVHTFRPICNRLEIKNYTETRLILQIQRKTKQICNSVSQKRKPQQICTRFCTFERERRESKPSHNILTQVQLRPRKKKAETSHPTSYTIFFLCKATQSLSEETTRNAIIHRYLAKQKARK